MAPWTTKRTPRREACPKRRFRRHIQYRRSRQNVHTLQISKARNQRIGKPKAKALIIGNSPHEKQ
jgi:hypothetical protein